MTWWQALILGIIEGITEYLPVSSTGHLVVAQQLLGIGVAGEEAKMAADAFAICIQAGAILAVLGIYRQRVWQMCLGLVGKDKDGLRLLYFLVIAFIPAAIIGLTLDSWIKTQLFGMLPIVIAWFIGGLYLLAFKKKLERKTVENEPDMMQQLTWKKCLSIGLFQCVAVCPGVSRSLMTISSGLFLGLTMGAALEFSFLLGVVTLGAATIKDAVFQGGLMLETYGWTPIIVGMLASWGSAVIAVKWLLSFLKRRGLGVFGWYRIILAVVISFYLFA